MKISVMRVREGLSINLTSLGWCKIESPIIPELGTGRMFLVVSVPGLSLLQLLKFDWREEFEVKEGESE